MRNYAYTRANRHTTRLDRGTWWPGSGCSSGSGACGSSSPSVADRCARMGDLRHHVEAVRHQGRGITRRCRTQESDWAVSEGGCSTATATWRPSDRLQLGPHRRVRPCPPGMIAVHTSVTSNTAFRVVFEFVYQPLALRSARFGGNQ